MDEDALEHWYVIEIDASADAAHVMVRACLVSRNRAFVAKSVFEAESRAYALAGCAAEDGPAPGTTYLVVDDVTPSALCEWFGPVRLVVRREHRAADDIPGISVLYDTRPARDPAHPDLDAFDACVCSILSVTPATYHELRKEFFARNDFLHLAEFAPAAPTRA